MSLSVRSATGDVCDVSEIVVRDDGNVPRLITEIWVRDENNLPRQVWGGLSGGGSTQLVATADTDNVVGATSSPGPRKVSTNAATVTATGGVSPYTYTWAASSGEMSADSLNAASSTFSATISGGETASDSFTCTVTDALGNTAESIAVAATVSNFGKQLNG